MSRTFFWRELRRQAPAALGMLALSWILLLGTTAFTRGHHLGAVAGFCFLLVPVLLGVYAFGPDLELGQERFLSVLPVSRGGLGALRLGTAAALTLAVDGMVFASFFALGALKTESWTEPASALWASMLLLPLGALAAVTVRHTLGALGATLCTLAVGPTVLDLLEEFHVRFDEVLVGALLVGWGAAALWLYGRARSTPPLKVAIPLGAAALLVGFLPAPAYGAFRYLTQDDPDAWRLSSTLLPAPAGRAFAVSRPDVRVGFKSAVGVWQPGDEAPRFVGLGSATWLGDWLVVSDAYAQGTLEVFELSTEALRRYDVDLVGVSAAPSAKQAVARALWVLDQDRQDLQGLLVDRVEDELWAVPAPIFKTVRGRGYAMDLLPCREWFDGGYCVKNLTRGTRWLPPPGTVVAALVGGWALLRDATGGCRAVNVVSGAEFLPERDLPPAQRTPWLQLVRVQERPMLLGLVHDEDDRLILWARDLNAPSSAQVAELPCEGLRSGDLPRVNVWPTAGPYLLIDPHPHRGPYEVSTWALDGVSLPVVRKQLAGAYGLCGPRAGDYLVVDPATRCLARCSGEEQGPPLEGLHEGVLSRARIAWLATGELLVAHRDGRVSRVNEGGALEPMLELGAPETWPGARKLSAR